MGLGPHRSKNGARLLKQLFRSGDKLAPNWRGSWKSSRTAADAQARGRDSAWRQSPVASLAIDKNQFTIRRNGVEKLLVSM
jgi:hypothetical protein